MTKKVPIRNLHSDKQDPPRFCYVVIDNGKFFLEKKTDKNKYEKISWEEWVYQVEVAKASNQ